MADNGGQKKSQSYWLFVIGLSIERNERLESGNIRKIVAAAYDLLENFGVMVDNEEALGILEDGGARVDVKEKVAYIPGGMVDKALTSSFDILFDFYPSFR